jgi:benzoyl-CoA reductase subunit A
VKAWIGIDLGSTTTKAIFLDEQGKELGRGITNSRSSYDLASRIAQDEGRLAARFTLLDRELRADDELAAHSDKVRGQLLHRFRRDQEVVQLEALRELVADECRSPRVAAIAKPLKERATGIVDSLIAAEKKPALPLAGKAAKTSDFFRDRAASGFGRLAEEQSDAAVKFADLLGVFDKAILRVENTPFELSFDTRIRSAIREVARTLPDSVRDRCIAAVERAAAIPLDEVRVIGTGYGRARLPFPKENIRSEILCHGLGAHAQFPGTRTVLDIGGQDTKAIQVDDAGIVTGFQMNDRCAAGCGRYLGYIADEMSLGIHELGPLAQQSERNVRITSTCTVFAGAELRDRLANGQRREDILAGLHRAVILRAMALLARSGGVLDEFTFTGGVANNPAAVDALLQLVEENYGKRTLNISAGSIFTGALGAALFALRADAAQA